MSRGKKEICNINVTLKLLTKFTLCGNIKSRNENKEVCEVEITIDIRHIMKKTGLSGEEISNIVDISYHDMSKIIQGKKKISDELRLKFLKLLGS